MTKQDTPFQPENDKIASEARTAYTPALFDLRPPNSAIIHGDAREVLSAIEEERFRCCVTSPPYWGLRDYDVEDQIGAEYELEDYIQSLVVVFRGVRRVLRDDGTLWLNIGDSYTSGNRKWRATDHKNPARKMQYRPPTPPGLKPKDLIGVPWRVALALQEDGWYLRSDIIWYKPNCQPESVKDRPTTAHEYIFLFSKSERYFYDHEAIKEPGVAPNTWRNRRTVWSVPTEPFSGAHFATFPPALVEPCILAGSERDDEVLDPFFGSGTVGLVCTQHQRSFTGIEIKSDYIKLAKKRIVGIQI